MKIRIQQKALLLEPETDFELEYLRMYQSYDVDGFLKTGIDLTHVIGLKIFPAKKKEKGTNE